MRVGSTVIFSVVVMNVPICPGFGDGAAYMILAALARSHTNPQTPLQSQIKGTKDKSKKAHAPLLNKR